MSARLPDMDCADGLACGLCSDSPATWEQVQGKPIPLCDVCWTEQVDTCPPPLGCNQKFFITEGVRLYTTPNLYCPTCANQDAILVAGREFEHQLDTKGGK